MNTGSDVGFSGDEDHEDSKLLSESERASDISHSHTFISYTHVILK